MTCKVEGCTSEVHAVGWCSKHYQRWRIHGDPEFTKYPGCEHGRSNRKKCPDCRRAESARRRAKYPEATRAYAAKWASERRARNRDQVFAHYGEECECCGENERAFLAVDHIYGGGTQHRREVGSDIYNWLVRNGFPDGFRILCHNCNWAEAHGGCPHRKKLEVAS